jgi:hypothetical protein
LVEKEELAAARRDEDPDEWRVKMRKRKRQNPGQEPIERALKLMRTTVELAPKGMKRSLDNGTTWAKRHKSVHWQVEWIREGNAGRSLSKTMGDKPIGEAYAEVLEAEKKSLMTEEEKILEKKQAQKQKERQKAETRKRLAREAKADEGFGMVTASTLQDPQTGAWGSVSAQIATLELTESSPAQSKPSTPGYHLYLHRPKTPSSFPKVIIPLNPTKPLEKLLRRRLVLEFPTIYVFKAEPDNLPDDFMLERDFLSATKQPAWQDSETEMRDPDEESSEEDRNVSETSSSGSDSDEDMEEGEVAD